MKIVCFTFCLFLFSTKSLAITLTEALTVDQISTGGWNTCAIHNNQLLCWGDNSYNQLTKSAPTSGSIFRVPLKTSKDIHLIETKIIIGYYRICILSKQKLFCSGRNDELQIKSTDYKQELNALTSLELPFQVQSLSLGAYHSCAISSASQSKNKVYCWGDNKSYQISSEDKKTYRSPTEIRSLPTKEWKQITSGFEHNCAISIDNEIYCWGGNSFGQITDPSSNKNHALKKMNLPDYSFTSISAGRFHTCTTTEKGKIFCWGANHFGQLGTGNTKHSHTPKKINSNDQYIQVSAGGVHTCAVTKLNKASCWGANSFMQVNPLGKIHKTKNFLTPKTIEVLDRVKGIHTGHTSTCAHSLDNMYSCWGTSSNGVPLD